MTAYVEIGPQPVLLGMGRQCVADDAGIGVAAIAAQGRRRVADAARQRRPVSTHAAASVDWRASTRRIRAVACRCRPMPSAARSTG